MRFSCLGSIEGCPTLGGLTRLASEPNDDWFARHREAYPLLQAKPIARTQQVMHFTRKGASAAHAR